jgi:hypothetical protein
VPDVEPLPDEDVEPPLDDVLDELLVLLDDPPEDVEEVEELLVSSFPPQAAIAVAPAKRSAARVDTRPGAKVGAGGAIRGSTASQNGHDASPVRTCRRHAGQGRRLATRRS